MQTRPRYICSRLNLSDYAGDIPHIDRSRGIPRIIHQTFPSSNLPSELRENIDGIRARNPEWEYKFYDDVAVLEFVRTHFDAGIAELFDRINPSYGAARADLFRYLLMYLSGGVYLDIKARVTKSLCTSIAADDEYVLAYWRNGPQDCHVGYGLHPELRSRGEYQQWHLIAARGHPFLRAVLSKVLRNIEEYVPYLDGVGRRGVLRVTGPIAYTLAIEPILEQHSHRCVSSEDSLGLQYSVYKSHTDHSVLFPKHYTQNAEPVVIGSRVATLMDAPFHLWRKGRAHACRLAKKGKGWNSYVRPS